MPDDVDRGTELVGLPSEVVAEQFTSCRSEVRDPTAVLVLWWRRRRHGDDGGDGDGDGDGDGGGGGARVDLGIDQSPRGGWAPRTGTELCF